MAMPGIYLDFGLSFDDAANREDSEDALVRLLGLTSRLNMMQLRKDPTIPPLYESGVVYTEPDQLVDRSRVTPAKRKQLVALCREMGLTPEEALMMLRVANGIEIFLDLNGLYRRGRGDCNELVPVRIAELWRNGIMASPYLTHEQKTDGSGGHSYHAVVWYPHDDSIEDPSLILGMGGPARAAERHAEIQKNADRRAAYIAAAQQLMAEGAPPETVAPLIDSMGFVPRDGVFRVRRAA